MNKDLIERLKNNWTAWGGLKEEEKECLLKIRKVIYFCFSDSKWLKTEIYAPFDFILLRIPQDYQPPEEKSFNNCSRHLEEIMDHLADKSIEEEPTALANSQYRNEEKLSVEEVIEKTCDNCNLFSSEVHCNLLCKYNKNDAKLDLWEHKEEHFYDRIKLTDKQKGMTIEEFGAEIDRPMREHWEEHKEGNYRPSMESLVEMGKQHLKRKLEEELEPKEDEIWEARIKSSSGKCWYYIEGTEKDIMTEAFARRVEHKLIRKAPKEIADKLKGEQRDD